MRMIGIALQYGCGIVLAAPILGKDTAMPHLAKLAFVAALSLALLTAGCGGGKKGNGYSYAPQAHQMAAVR
jgi:hypothetical protein